MSVVPDGSSQDHRLIGVVRLLVVMVLVAIPALTSCAWFGPPPGRTRLGSGNIEITDMLNRRVRVPKDIHRILALHPIPTTVLELLAPRQLASVDTVFARSLKSDDARFSAEQMSSLKSLPVTGVYFKGFDPELLVRLRPDVVITMTGDTNIDREQRRTGIPFFAVSKVPTASYETTIRLIGQIVGRGELANRMAAFWAETVASVRAKTDTLAVIRRPTVLYTGQGGDIFRIPGNATVFGSTIDTAGGNYVGESLPAGRAGLENNSVTIEEILAWDPAVIIVASTGARDRIMADARWRRIRAVHDGRVYVPPRYGGLDGLQALLGMAWAQDVLLEGDNAGARVLLTAITQSYYRLFYGHRLTTRQLAQLAN